MSGFGLELMYISLIISMRSNLTDPHTFQQLVHRNHFFHLYQQNKSKSKVNFRQVSNHCKRGLETAKIAYPTQTKGSITTQKLGSRTFRKLPIFFSIKVNLLYLLYSTTQRCCLLHLIKQNYSLKTFLITLILMTQVSVELFSFLELI